MKRALLFAAVLIAVASALLGQSPNAASQPYQVAGVYRLNLANSTYEPGPKPLAGHVSVYTWTIRPDGFTAGLTASITPQGVPSYTQTFYKYDGKDYPSYGNGRVALLLATGEKTNTTLAFIPIDAYSVQIIGKTDGKVPNPNQKRIRTISKDGKTMTDATTGTNAQGQKVNNILIYEKVQ